MERDDSQDLERRISLLESRLDDILLRLEGSLPSAPRQTEPNTFPLRKESELIVPPPKLPVFPQEADDRADLGFSLYPRSKSVPSDLSSKEDMTRRNENDSRISADAQYKEKWAAAEAERAAAIEYKVGINGLLRGGIVVIVVAILFLVARIVGSGAITPQLQFAFELVMCGLFIGVGFWKEGEREEFGKMMVGLGSFGLYATFAGAHVYKNLFPGEVLVVLFALLGLINLGYAHWRKSKAFLTIGLLGGLIAAVLPMQKGAVLLDFVLHFLILVPTAAVILKQRWNHMAILMWICSTLALLPATTSDAPQLIRVVATYLNCFVALIAFAKTHDEEGFDPKGLVHPALLLLTGLFAVGIDSGQKGSVHALILACVGLLVAMLVPKGSVPRTALLFGALLVVSILMPIGFNSQVATTMYAVESLILASIALRYSSKPFWGLNIVCLALAGVGYLWIPGRPSLEVAVFPRIWEMAVLAVFIGSQVVSGMFSVKHFRKDQTELVLFIGGSLTMLFACRGFFVSLDGWLDSSRVELLSGVLVVLGGTAASVVLKRDGIWLANAIALIIVSATFLVTDLGTDSANRAGFLSLGMLALAGSWVFYCKSLVVRFGREVIPVFFLGGAIDSLFAIRVFLLLWPSAPGRLETILTILALGWAAGGLALRKSIDADSADWKISLRGVSFSLAVLIASFNGIILMGRYPLSVSVVDTFITGGTLVAFILMYCIYEWKVGEEIVVTAFVFAACWGLSTAFFGILIRGSGLLSDAPAIVTASWVLYAVTLIVAGFRLDRRLLRYWSMAMFFFIISKVLLFDLVTLDSMIRVGILLLLGIGMVSGGYWYILWNRKGEAPSVVE